MAFIRNWNEKEEQAAQTAAPTLGGGGASTAGDTGMPTASPNNRVAQSTTGAAYTPLKTAMPPTIIDNNKPAPPPKIINQPGVPTPQPWNPPVAAPAPVQPKPPAMIGRNPEQRYQPRIPEWWDYGPPRVGTNPNTTESMYGKDFSNQMDEYNRKLKLAIDDWATKGGYQQGIISGDRGQNGMFTWNGEWGKDPNVQGFIEEYEKTNPQLVVPPRIDLPKPPAPMPPGMEPPFHIRPAAEPFQERKMPDGSWQLGPNQYAQFGMPAGALQRPAVAEPWNVKVPGYTPAAPIQKTPEEQARDDMFLQSVRSDSDRLNAQRQAAIDFTNNNKQAVADRDAMFLQSVRDQSAQANAVRQKSIDDYYAANPDKLKYKLANEALYGKDVW